MHLGSLLDTAVQLAKLESDTRFRALTLSCVLCVCLHLIVAQRDIWPWYKQAWCDWRRNRRAEAAKARHEGQTQLDDLSSYSTFSATPDFSLQAVEVRSLPRGHVTTRPRPILGIHSRLVIETVRYSRQVTFRFLETMHSLNYNRPFLNMTLMKIICSPYFCLFDHDS